MNKEDIKILIVDDEPDIIEIISFNLKKKGYQTLSAGDGLEAIKLARKELPQLIIMDIMMPNLDGIEACELLRQESIFSETIIMFLTARAEDFSYVAAFDAGADDYIIKPIKPKVLVSKVKGLLRRFKDKKVVSNQLVYDNLVIDKDKYSVNLNGKELSFPRKEFELLYLLASNPDRVIKREKIMEMVWGNNVVVGDRTIDVHIRKLREKLGKKYLKTIKGLGYKFISEQN